MSITRLIRPAGVTRSSSPWLESIGYSTPLALHLGHAAEPGQSLRRLGRYARPKSEIPIETVGIHTRQGGCGCVLLALLLGFWPDAGRRVGGLGPGLTCYSADAGGCPSIRPVGRDPRFVAPT